MARRRSLLLLCLCCVYLFEIITAEVHAPVVKIKNGTLSGLIMKTRRGREIVGFRGIPYALPPLGKLRFEPPKPAAAWDGVRSAKENANLCTQRNIYIHQEEIVGVEDCLYLNVYTPKLPTATDNLNGGFPVLVWIHGCGWICGAGHSDFYHPKFLLDHDVVLVTMNYRLGPLGFLSTEDTDCPGNNGLKDQAQSIRWVHENIAAFGGDPNSVTLFGESAGGASVYYHMISNLTKEYFHRAISQSGSVYCPWTLTRPGSAKEKAAKVAELLNCPSKDTKQLLDCLRTKSADDIIGTDRAFQEFGYSPMIPFRPVIEPVHPGAFITEDPILATKHGSVSDIPWMTGITSEEGALLAPALYGRNNGELVRRLNNDFSTVGPITLFLGESCPKDQMHRATREIREFYFGDKPIDNSTRLDVVDMYSDSWFTYPAHVSVADYLKEQSSPVYYYYLAYEGSSSFSTLFGDAEQKYGVSHADELQYLFPVGEQLFQDTPLSEKDHKMVDIFTSLWVNFAKSGNPTPRRTEQIPVKWKPVRTQALEYLYIGGDELRMGENLNPERLNFWKRIPVRPNIVGSDERQLRKDEL